MSKNKLRDKGIEAIENFLTHVKKHKLKYSVMLFIIGGIYLLFSEE